MIVQCPSCTSRYRIRDANIPPSGGKIRCPSCAHSFIVYPESHEEDDQKTSITGSNELAKLAGGMAGGDDGATEIVGGDAIDKMRAIEALKREMGSALDGDGTVEMQNPLDMWKAAQAAQSSAAPTEDSADAEEAVPQYGDPDIDPDEYDTAKTEIVSPDALDFSNLSGGLPEQQPQEKPSKPSIPRPNIPRPGTQGSGPAKPPWEDPDRTIDAGLSGGTNGIETASVKAPDSIPEMRNPEMRDQEPDAAPARTGPAGPPALPPPGPRSQSPAQEQPPAQQRPQAQQQPPTQQHQQPQAQQQPPAQQYQQPQQHQQQQQPQQQQQQPPSSGLSADELFGSTPPAEEAPPKPVTGATQEDSGPSAPTTDPFSLPESDPFASAGGSSPADAPSVPVGGSSDEAFAANAPEEPAGGPDPRHQGPWKLKTNFGLTYEFPDNKSLRSWMSSREELDGHTLSADGVNFYEIHEFPQLHRSPSMVSQQIPSYSADQRPSSGAYSAQQPQQQQAQRPVGVPSSDAPVNPPGTGPGGSGQFPSPGGSQPGNAQTASPGFTSPASFGSGPQPAMGGESAGLGGAKSAPNFGNTGPADRSGSTVQNEYVPPSQSSAWDKVLWLVLLVLILAAGVIAVQTFGIFDIVGEARKVLGMPAKTEQQVRPSPGSDDGSELEALVVDDGELEEQQTELAERLLRDAKRDIEKNRLPAALKKLETVAEIDSSNIEIYQMRVQVHEKLGQTEEAEAARARIAEIENAAVGDQPDAGTPDAS